MNQNLQVGDIINWHWKAPSWWLRTIWKLQALFDRSKSQHSSLYIGDNKVLEMLDKMTIRNVGNVSYSKSARILRVDSNKTQENIQKAIKEYTESKGGIGADYPEHELFQLGVATMLEGFIQLFTGKDVDIPILIDTKTDVCSTLVSEVWRIAGINLCNSKNVTPGDLERSGLTKVIKDYKKVI